MPAVDAARVASRPVLARGPGVAVVALAACAGLSACGGAGGTSQSAKAVTTPASTITTVTAPVRQARRACDSSVAKVIKTYLPAARKRGGDKALLRMAADPPKRVTNGPGYALLAGAIYANGLPVKQRAGVAPACAKQLLSKKSMSNEGTSR